MMNVHENFQNFSRQNSGMRAFKDFSLMQAMNIAIIGETAENF